MGLAGAPALGGDHHDAVRAARAVDRGGGILQDVDRLDLVGVDAADGSDILAAHAELRVVLLDDRNAVDDVEWLVAGVDRRRTAYADGDAVTRVAGVLHHLDTRGFPLERGIDACNGVVCNLRCRDGRDCAAHVLAVRRTVADHDDLGERARHRDEREVGRGGRPRSDRDADVAGREPDALRADRDGAGRDVANGVFAGVVRERADLCAGDGDAPGTGRRPGVVESVATTHPGEAVRGIPRGMFGRREQSVKMDQTTFAYGTRQALGSAPAGECRSRPNGIDVRPPDQLGQDERRRDEASDWFVGGQSGSVEMILGHEGES